MTREGFFLHESSYVDDGVHIGVGTKIWHFCHVLKGSRIGADCILGQNCMVGPDVTIGDRCKFQNNVSVYTGVTIEDGVFCGPSCVFTNVNNPRAFIERKHEFRPTLVRTGATIGANATIVCGTTIGRYAVIAAGAVVKKDVADYAIVAGVPSRPVGWACKCGMTLLFRTLDCGSLVDQGKGGDWSEQARCTFCGNEYRLDRNRVLPIVEM
jgi:UDP-2-acetamido-3-amino-2,3-dideoxy-glucuronate N-acetyltransferase